MTGRPTTILSGLVFPEGPRWRNGRLWLSDIHGHQVLSVTMDGQTELAGLVDKPNGLGFLPDGTLLALSMHARQVMRVGGGAASLWMDLGEYPGEFINDMVVDGEGFTYVGMRSWRRSGQAPGSDDRIILIRPDRTTAMVAEQMTAPNGMVITADGSTLIVAETHGLRLTAFDRLPTGGLTNKRTFAALDPELLGDGRKPFPDGICLDAEGAIWVGTAMSGEYLRVAPGGEILDRFRPNAAWATACMLGGPEGKHLFLATCDGSLEALGQFRSRSLADEGDRQEYLAWATGLSQGFVEVIEVGTPAAGYP